MVRELFVMDCERALSISFIDEIDSIGSSRIESNTGGDSEVQCTMLELINSTVSKQPRTLKSTRPVTELISSNPPVEFGSH